jgi:hypothetical protein
MDFGTGHANILTEAWKFDVRDQPECLCEMDKIILLELIKNAILIELQTARKPAPHPRTERLVRGNQVNK